MRNLKRDPAFQSWHPAQKKKMAHLIMRHMNPQRGFFMRQAEFGKEVGVRREAVNGFLKQAVEREFLTCRRSMFTETWKGVNTYFVHPRLAVDPEQATAHLSAHDTAHTTAQQEVPLRKLRQGSSAPQGLHLEAPNEAPPSTRPAACANAPASRKDDDEAVAWEARFAAADDWVEELSLNEENVGGRNAGAPISGLVDLAEIGSPGAASHEFGGSSLTHDRVRARSSEHTAALVTDRASKTARLRELATTCACGASANRVLNSRPLCDKCWPACMACYEGRCPGHSPHDDIPF